MHDTSSFGITTLSVQRATVDSSARAGVASLGATVSLSGSLVECNAI